MHRNPIHTQRGFAVLTYVLVAIFLISAVGAMMAASRWGSNTADKQWSAAMDIVSQASMIRSKLMDCAALGTNGGFVSSQTTYTNNTTYHPTFPATPANSVAAPNRPLLSDTKCPNPSNNTVDVFSGVDGIFLPPTPAGFYAWVYRNDGTSVRIELVAQSAASATQWSTAMTTARDKLGTNVASLQTTTTSNDTLRVIITN